MVVEFSYLGGDSTVLAGNRCPFQIDDGTSNNRIYAYNHATPSTRARVTVGGATQSFPEVSGSVAVGTIAKLALTWKANDVQVSVNGAHGTRDVSGTVPAVTAIGIGARSFGGTELFGLVYGWTIYDDHYPTDAGMDALTTPTTTRNQSRLTLGLGLGL